MVTAEDNAYTVRMISKFFVEFPCADALIDEYAREYDLTSIAAIFHVHDADLSLCGQMKIVHE